MNSQHSTATIVAGNRGVTGENLSLVVWWGRQVRQVRAFALCQGVEKRMMRGPEANSEIAGANTNVQLNLGMRASIGAPEIKWE